MRESKGIKLNTANIPSVVKMASANFGNYRGRERRRVPAPDRGRGLHPLRPCNAVTRYSQDVESYDRATKLEEIGYSVMTMSRSCSGGSTR